jgi:hypothetical protein
MAVNAKNVVRSILESMLFLAVLGSSISILSMFMRTAHQEHISVYIAYPLLCSVSSLVVAMAFPKPTYWRAFWKLFAGGLLTFAIVGVLAIVIGPKIFTLLLDVLWSAGGYVWDWSSADSIILGIFAVLFYILLTILIMGLIMSALFALTNFFVLLGMNMVVERRQQAQPVQNPPQDGQLPFN